MARHYTRRLLPLLDVMMLLFGLLIILLVTANFEPVQASSSDDAQDDAADELVEALLAGRPYTFLEVTRDLQVRHVPEPDTYGRSLGHVDDIDKAGVDELVADAAEGEEANPEDVLVIVLYQRWPDGRHFTPERQHALLRNVGEQRAFLTQTPVPEENR